MTLFSVPHCTPVRAVSKEDFPTEGKPTSPMRASPIFCTCKSHQCHGKFGEFNPSEINRHPHEVFNDSDSQSLFALALCTSKPAHLPPPAKSKTQRHKKESRQHLRHLRHFQCAKCQVLSFPVLPMFGTPHHPAPPINIINGVPRGGLTMLEVWYLNVPENLASARRFQQVTLELAQLGLEPLNKMRLSVADFAGDTL